tara:strand:+ start:609 stop:1247 length:639 start_codon:yes stop_codon:yes gene_type:complete
MGVNSPFDIPILIEDIEDGEDIAKEVCDAAYDLRDKDPHGKLISHKFREYKRAESKEEMEKHGYTSHGTFNLKEDQRFHRVHTATVDAMAKYLTHMKSCHQFRLTNSWVSIYGHGSFAPEHVHPLCHLSCVFYGAASEGTGELVLKNPAQDVYNMLYEGGDTDLFTDLYNVSPRAGQIVVFPSFMKHYTKPHMANDDRIIFSCNAKLTSILP